MVQIDSRSSRAFLIACQEGTIRGAAEILDLEPSSVSRQITDLENSLNIALIERSRRGVSPTEAGQLLLSYLKQQQADVEVLLSDFDALQGMRKGEIIVAIGDGFISDFISNALPTFRAAMPGLTFQLNSGSTDKVVQLVANDTVHFGLAYNARADKMLRTLVRSRQPLEVLFSPSSELAHSDKAISLKQLCELPMALPMPKFGIGALLKETEVQYGIKLQAIMETNSLAALRNFVREDIGVTVLPAFVVAREIADGLIATRPLDVDELAKGETAIIVRNGRRLPESATRLINHAARTMLAFRK